MHMQIYQGLNLETVLTSGESSFPIRVLCSWLQVALGKKISKLGDVALNYLLTRTWLQTARLVHNLDAEAEANEAATINQVSQSVLPDKAARVGFGGGAARGLTS